MTYIFLALLVAIIVWRVVLPGLRLEKTSAAGTGTGGGTATNPPAKPSAVDLLKSNVLTVLLIVIGGGVVLWGFYRPVHLADVMSWREYWFALVILWGVGAALVAINTTGVMAKTLQWVLAGVMLMLFVGLPVVNYFWGEKSPPVQAQSIVDRTICPNASAKETRTCFLTSDWANWIQYADGAVDNGKQLCYFPLAVQWERKDENGVTSLRFKVASGTQPLRFKLFTMDYNCSNFVG